MNTFSKTQQRIKVNENQNNFTTLEAICNYSIIFKFPILDTYIFVGNKYFVSFLKLEAEDIPELSEKYQIAAVPTFIFIKVIIGNDTYYIACINSALSLCSHSFCKIFGVHVVEFLAQKNHNL